MKQRNDHLACVRTPPAEKSMKIKRLPCAAALDGFIMAAR
jgi:hypothetical protein